MHSLKRHLTYANVTATLALFLVLGGGIVWAAQRIGSRQLKPASVGPAKLKKGAVTTPKIHRGAVTAGKLRNEAVVGSKIRGEAIGIDKIAPGTNVIAIAHGGPVRASLRAPIAVPLDGTTSFVPGAAGAYFLSVEAEGRNLGIEPGEEECAPTVVTFVNGSEWDVAQGSLTVRAFDPTTDEPTGLLPVTGATAPVGLVTPGNVESIAMKVYGDTNCTDDSQIAVGLAVTQEK